MVPLLPHLYPLPRGNEDNADSGKVGRRGWGGGEGTGPGSGVRAPPTTGPLFTHPQVLPVFLLRVQPGPRVHREVAPAMVRGWGLAQAHSCPFPVSPFPPPSGNNSISSHQVPALPLPFSLDPGCSSPGCTGCQLTLGLPPCTLAQGRCGSPGPLQPGGAEQEEVL